MGPATLTTCVILALMAPLFISSVDVSATLAQGRPRQPPSAQFILGTDMYGRSMVAVTIWGARNSLVVGLLATALSAGIGTMIGLVAGHFRGWIGVLLVHVTDWFLALPTFALAAALAGVMRPGIGPVILAIGLTSWPVTARLVRAQTLTAEARPYVDRSRALGGGHWHILRRHTVADVAPLVLVQATLSISGAILTEAALAFLGLADPTAVSWGTTLQQARQVGSISAGEWWILGPPGLAITLTSLAFVLFGRSLEQKLHPRLRRPE
jgi:peptide/nickel transport system permease protein